MLTNLVLEVQLLSDNNLKNKQSLVLPKQRWRKRSEEVFKAKTIGLSWHLEVVSKPSPNPTSCPLVLRWHIKVFLTLVLCLQWQSLPQRVQC